MRLSQTDAAADAADILASFISLQRCGGNTVFGGRARENRNISRRIRHSGFRGRKTRRRFWRGKCISPAPRCISGALSVVPGVSRRRS